MPRRYKTGALIALLILLSGCGPTERECGQAIVLMAPLITVIGAGIAALFQLLWTPLVPSHAVSLRGIRNAAIGLLLPCIPVAFSQYLEGDWLFATFCAVGASYLTILLVCIRIAVLSPMQRVYRHIYYLPWIILYPSAGYFAFFGSVSNEPNDFHLQLWIMPGYFGLVAGPIFLVALFEVLVRRYKLHQRKLAEALPRPLPVATLKNR